ncbi:hypothetical protein [Vibrio nigripulchritudo]|uniref:hypothetical protein n=1 Tax=Vibrio nigripulchritudo TaxID=28173 RepID=UPI00249331C7|nr:hypothetical protein [Vibrio nigripulchritudo]
MSKYKVIQDINTLSAQLTPETISSMVEHARRIVTVHRLWSSLPALEYLPFRLILSGIQPGLLHHNEPECKSNAFEYHFDASGALIQIASYGKKGQVEWREWIDPASNMSIEQDKYGDFLAATQLTKDTEGNIVSAIHFRTIRSNIFAMATRVSRCRPSLLTAASMIIDRTKLWSQRTFATNATCFLCESPKPLKTRVNRHVTTPYFRFINFPSTN